MDAPSQPCRLRHTLHAHSSSRATAPGKRTKYEESKDKGEMIEHTPPHLTKETRQSPTPHVFLDPTLGLALPLPSKPRSSGTKQVQDMTLQDRTPFSSWQIRNRTHPENPENPSKPPKGALPQRNLAGTAEHRKHVLPKRHDPMS